MLSSQRKLRKQYLERLQRSGAYQWMIEQVSAANHV